MEETRSLKCGQLEGRDLYPFIPTGIIQLEPPGLSKLLAGQSAFPVGFYWVKLWFSFMQDLQGATGLLASVTKP